MTSTARLNGPVGSNSGVAPAGNRAGAPSASARAGRAQASAARRPDNHVIIMFRATGDLPQRKLLPELFHLATAPNHRLPPKRY